MACAFNIHRGGSYILPLRDLFAIVKFFVGYAGRIRNWTEITYSWKTVDESSVEFIVSRLNINLT